MKKNKLFLVLMVMAGFATVANAQYYYKQHDPKEIIDKSDDFNIGDRAKPKCSLSVFKSKKNDKKQNKNDVTETDNESETPKKTKDKIICVDPNNNYYNYDYNRRYKEDSEEE